MAGIYVQNNIITVHCDGWKFSKRHLSTSDTQDMVTFIEMLVWRPSLKTQDMVTITEMLVWRPSFKTWLHSLKCLSDIRHSRHGYIHWNASPSRIKRPADTDTWLYDTIQYDMLRFVPIQYNTIQYNIRLLWDDRMQLNSRPTQPTVDQ